MKSMARKNEWRQLSKESLELNFKTLKEKLRSLRFLSASGKLKNVCEIKGLRKDIARISTILKETRNKKP
jgi:ribosomal protein L29